ncbi:MAG: DUF3574 domain-containing protein [Opitutae bacterium]|nr:DUF3574 domain-containing protein [Opitutae bacterium]
MVAIRQFPPCLRFTLVGIALLSAGCVSVEHLAAPTASTSSAAATFCDRLNFGRAIPAGGEITDAQWAAFVEEVIVPGFPNGFTIYRGDCNWKGDDGVHVRESAPPFSNSPTRSTTRTRAVDEIATTYRKRFAQEAVLLVRTPAVMKFYRKE